MVSARYCTSCNCVRAAVVESTAVRARRARSRAAAVELPGHPVRGGRLQRDRTGWTRAEAGSTAAHRAHAMSIAGARACLPPPTCPLTCASASGCSSQDPRCSNLPVAVSSPSSSGAWWCLVLLRAAFLAFGFSSSTSPSWTWSLRRLGGRRRRRVITAAAAEPARIATSESERTSVRSRGPLVLHPHSCTNPRFISPVLTAPARGIRPEERRRPTQRLIPCVQRPDVRARHAAGANRASAEI